MVKLPQLILIHCHFHLSHFVDVNTMLVFRGILKLWGRCPIRPHTIRTQYIEKDGENVFPFEKVLKVCEVRFEPNGCKGYLGKKLRSHFLLPRGNGFLIRNVIITSDSAVNFTENSRSCFREAEQTSL